MARYAQSGRVDWIGVRPERRADMLSLEGCRVVCAGLAGDRARAGKRAVTLMQAEHLSAIAQFIGRDMVRPQELRRNLLISGINLAALKGRLLRAGSVELQLTGICAPCSRMEEVLGRGGYSAVRGHGGWCAEVTKPGEIAIGDEVHPID